jgi:bifunctional non-homologous end joining protein LigD
MAQQIVMLCEKGQWKAFPQGPDWIYEVKFDGIRVLASKQGAEVRLVGRSGEDYTSKFPEVVTDLQEYQQDLILDGELCSADGDFRTIAGRVHLQDRFRIELSAKVSPAIYHIFDLLRLGDTYLVKQPLRERKRLLEQQLGEKEHVKIVRPQPLEELVRRAEAQEIEGLVAKNLNSTYELHRSPSWVKFRPAESLDLPIVGYEESDKPERPFRSVILLWKGRELQAASGLTEQDLQYAFQKFREARVVRTVREAGRNKHYFEAPVGEAEVVFTSTPNLPTRFPRLLKLKWDRQNSQQ